MPKTKTSDVATKMVGQAVRKARRDLNLTQAEVAQRLGVNPTYMTNVEAGRVNLTVGQLAAVAEALQSGLSVEFPSVVSPVTIDRSMILVGASDALDKQA